MKTNFVKIVCDRCKMEQFEETNAKESNFSRIEFKGNGFDLCRECAEKFFQMITMFCTGELTEEQVDQILESSAKNE